MEQRIRRLEREMRLWRMFAVLAVIAFGATTTVVATADSKASAKPHNDQEFTGLLVRRPGVDTHTLIGPQGIAVKDGEKTIAMLWVSREKSALLKLDHAKGSVTAAAGPDGGDFTVSGFAPDSTGSEVVIFARADSVIVGKREGTNRAQVAFEPVKNQ